MSLSHVHTIAEVDALLGQARTVLAIKKARGGIIELDRVRRQIDKLLDRRLQLSGPPVCQGPGCGRVKGQFGSSTWLCLDCDFIMCAALDCERRVLALDSLYCNPCTGRAAAPWPPT